MNRMKILVLLLTVSVSYISCFELNSVTVEQFRNTTGWFQFNNSTETYNGTNLMRLDLSLKGITSINANAFERYKEQIVYLRFYGNKITKIVPEVFAGMKNLITLDLSYMQLAECGLPFLPSLTSLTFNINQLTRFDMKVNQLFPNLSQLDLGYNQLSYILPNAFHDSALTVLRLPANGFKTIDVNLFQRMTKLNQLYLERNLFTTVTTPFRVLPKLELLELSQNQISVISKDVFIGIQGLKHLLIYNNKLTSIEPDLFENIQLLKSFHVNNNLLTKLPDGLFDLVPDLTNLYAGFNSFQSLSSSLLAQNSLINHIDLQANKFTTVPNLFYHTSLEIINLSSNLLSTVDYKLFNGLIKLKYLYFRQNPLKVPVDSDALLKITNAKLTLYL